MQPTPYIDEQTGKRFYNVRQAAQMVEGVSEATMWKWAKRGVTSFGFKLDVEQRPIIHHRPWGKTKAKEFRHWRMLIPEAKVLALRGIFESVGREVPGRFLPGERNALKAAVRNRSSQLSL